MQVLHVTCHFPEYIIGEQGVQMDDNKELCKELASTSFCGGTSTFSCIP